MKHLLKTLPVLLLFLTFSLAAQTPAIPDTPAGRTLRAWLDAFNSGDRARMQDYLAKYDPAKSVENQLNFRNQTGGFDLISIEKTDRLNIEFVVKEKAVRNNSSQSAVGKLTVKDVVKDADPASVATFTLRAIPPGMTAADMNLKIDAATRARVVNEAIAKLNEFYVFEETAKKMAEAVESRLKGGEYDALTSGDEFAARLMSDLRAVSHDKHLRVEFSLQVLPKNENPTPNPAAVAQRRAQMERNNCAFEKVEWLPSNIGYLKFNGFPEPEICGSTVAAAMNFLAHTDALIIDLRENNGGSPKMIAYICSYFFAEPTRLSDVYSRKDDKTTEYWTSKDVPGARLVSKPIFILTANRTFSAAEAFAYDLKSLKRATVIGETTGGGAHPVSAHRIDDHFRIGVPYARAINPITKTNWEGTGVEPDVKVPASEALEVAKKMALEQIRKR